MVVTASLLDRLAAHRTLASVPRDQLAWLASAGVECTLEPGDILTSSTGPVRGLYVVFDGHLSIRVDRGAGPSIVMEWHGGDVTGMLPYSRIKSPPGSVVAEERTHLLELDTAELPRMIRECPELTAVLVHVMLDRARVFKSSELLDEKMLSLGRLAAGLAHELNNPASAVARSAKTLIRRARRPRCGDQAILRPQPVRRRSAGRLRACATQHAGSRPALSPLELADRQDAIDDWLAAHRVAGARRRAAGRVRLSPPISTRSTRSSGPDKVAPVLTYVASGQTVRQLATEIDTAATRIHSLVAAVKGFTYVDQQATLQPIAIGAGAGRHGDRAPLEGARRSRSTFSVDVPEHLPDGRRLRRRAQSGVGESGRQRHRRDARRTRARSTAGRRRRQVIVRVDRRRPRHSGRTSRTASSIRSSRPRTSARAPDSASTSPGASCSVTTARST